MYIHSTYQFLQYMYVHVQYICMYVHVSICSTYVHVHVVLIFCGSNFLLFFVFLWSVLCFAGDLVSFPESQTKQFSNFLLRANRYPSLQVGVAGGWSQHCHQEKKIVLVEVSRNLYVDIHVRIIHVYNTCMLKPPHTFKATICTIFWDFCNWRCKL